MRTDPKRFLVAAAIVGFLLFFAFFIGPAVAATPVGVVPVALVGLFAIVGAAFWFLARYAPRLDMALEDSTYERFQRLEGLYRCIPNALRDSPANQAIAAEFEKLRAELEDWINPKTYTFTRNDAVDLVHNLHMLYLQVAPAPYLGFMMPALRNDFRDAVGAGAYEAYLAAPSHKQLECTKDSAESERLLRADATFLVNQTRLEVLSKQHVETTRQTLMRAALLSWWWNVIPLLAVLIIFLFCQACADHAERQNSSRSAAVAAAATPEEKERAAKSNRDWATDFAERYLLNQHKIAPPESLPASSGTPTAQTFPHTTLYQVIIAAALLALVGIAGASGGLLSVIQRIQNASGNTNAGADLRALAQSETAVFFAPVTGVIFAIVLSAMFAGQVVSGTLFPNVNTYGPWFFTLWSATEMAKWLLWAFIAGFSERLVPDMLNSFEKKAQEKAAAPMPAGATNALAVTTGSVAAHQAVPTDESDFAEAEIQEDDIFTPAPVLYSHPDAIPPDASELTITGQGFSQATEIYVDGQPKAKSSLLEVTNESLRLRLNPADFFGKTEIVVKAKNPEPGGGESQPLAIPVSQPGG